MNLHEFNNSFYHIPQKRTFNCEKRSFFTDMNNVMLMFSVLLTLNLYSADDVTVRFM